MKSYPLAVKRGISVLTSIILSIGGMLLIGSFFPFVLHTYAQGGGEDYNGVDIVFLIDQSGSMGGKQYGNTDHPEANDPNDLRFSGLQEMIERLGAYRLNYFHNSDIQFQISVLYFGDQTETIVPPTIIDPDASDMWQPLANDLRKKLSSESFPRNLGNTDHLLALQQAREVLQTMKQNWKRGAHRQVILMLTDGEWAIPCPPPAGLQASSYCQDNKFQRWQYRQDLDEYIRTQLPYPEYSFFVGAINDRSQEYWSHVRGYWEKWTHNNATLLESDTMWAFFENILGNLTVNDPVLSGKMTTPGTMVEIPVTQTRIAVPPYLQEITFVIHKPKPTLQVELYNENGQLLEKLSNTAITGRDSYIERITVSNPEPGYITIKRAMTTKILRIFMIQLGADVTCDMPSSVPQFVPMRLQCTMSSQYGSLPFYQDPHYWLTVTAEITGSGETRHLVLSPPGKNDQSGTYTAYYLPGQIGKHTLALIATTEKPNGEPFELFRKPPDKAHSFTVETTHLQLETINPPVSLVPVSMSVQLMGTDGQPLPIPPDSIRFVTLHIRLQGKGGVTEIELQPHNTIYGGVFTPTWPGRYQVQLKGEVEDPSSGQSFTAYDEQMQPLEVAAPELSWEGFSGDWSQYNSAPISFRLLAPNGNPFVSQMDTDWNLNAEAVWETTGETITIPLTSDELGHWQGEFTPREAGSFTIQASVTASRGGEEVALVQNARLTSAQIRPMTLVQGKVQYPALGSKLAWRDIFWRYKPMEIEVAAVDESGQPLAPGQILQQINSLPLRAEIIAPDGKVISDSLTLQPAGEPGRYYISWEYDSTLPWYVHRDLGQYQIHLLPGDKLKDTYIYDHPFGKTHSFYLTRDPYWWVMPSVLGLLLFLLILWGGRSVYLHLWSIEGTLRVEYPGVTSWSRQLGDYGKHTLVFSGKATPQGIRKIKISQRRGEASINLYITHQKGGTQTYIMTDRSRKPLVGGRYVTFDRGRGAGKSPALSINGWVAGFGLLTLLGVFGLAGVLFAVVQSLS